MSSLILLSFCLLLFHVPQEEAIPELEIDVDELLDMPSDVERAARVKVRHAYTLVPKHNTCVETRLQARKQTISCLFCSLTGLAG